MNRSGRNLNETTHLRTLGGSEVIVFVARSWTGSSPPSADVAASGKFSPAADSVINAPPNRSCITAA